MVSSHSRTSVLPLSVKSMLAIALMILLSGQLPALAADSAPKSSKIRVAFIGDSTADGLWSGAVTYSAQQKCLKGLFNFGRYAKNGVGLTRIDKYDIAEETSKIVENYQPNIIVISLGLNDRQPIVEPLPSGRKVTQYESPEWPKRYKAHVIAVLRAAAAAKVPVLWVGLPVMREAEVNRDAQQKNKIFAEAVTELAASGVQFIPPWHLNESGEDVFASYAPGKDGKMVHIRTSDGEHFTSAGDELVAAYLLPKIIASLKRSGT